MLEKNVNQRNVGFAAFTCITIGFILYVLADNLIVDPGAKQFLSSKTGSSRELNVAAWTSVMYVHVAFACVAMASGLLNFSVRMSENSRAFHRINGYVYVASVLVVVLTSGYMAPYATGGKISSVGFNLLNMIWLFVTVTALVHIKKKRIARHRDWMIRSYAFCFTNMLIHLTTALLHEGFGVEYAASYTVGVYSSIAILLVVPNFIIGRRR